jgi:hypothetical protein
LLNVAEPSDIWVPFRVVKYVKLTAPVGVPATDVTVAVIETGWPSVVVDSFADNAVKVMPCVSVTDELEDVDPAFTASPL